MRILIVDDHPLTCNGLRLLLQASYPSAEIVALHTASAAQQELDEARPFDWIFLDIGLPDDPQRNLLARLREPSLAIKTVLISAQIHHELIRDALQAGIRGFIPKSADPELVLDGVRRIFQGEIYLPPELTSLPGAEHGTDMRPLSIRQQQVLALILRGCPNKTIARELDLTLNTVKEYVSTLLKLHSVASRLELVLRLRPPQ